MEDAAFGGGFLQRQGKQICAEEVLPEIVVGRGVGEVDIGPDDETFAFWVGGTLEPLKEFKAEDDRGLDLRVEGVDKTDVGVNSSVAAVGRSDGGNGEDVNSNGTEMGVRGGIMKLCG